MAWKISHMPDLDGKRAVVTGANAGLGFYTCLHLAKAGASVVLATRNETAGHEAADRIRNDVPGAVLDVVRVDLADLSSVRTAAAVILKQDRPIDMLINNAGVMATPKRLTLDGFELQFGTNHLGHFALTGLLLPALGSARVVTVSSLLHNSVAGVPDRDPREARKYNKWQAYGESKLANLMFMLELDRRAQVAGLELTSVAAHPGYASTRLQRSGPRLGGPSMAAYLLAGLTSVVSQSADAGAWPTLYAATAPKMAGGTYIGPSRLMEMRGRPQPVGMSKAARDRDAARRLWLRSQEATGVSYL
ncbi:MAG: SDR family NAD(P)-dependent oxidoreductase [Propionibacteriales bacterium]|nr:SDR family NAD(P)-dependent oxidoreductase [Propionibacteriales bacterium]